MSVAERQGVLAFLMTLSYIIWSDARACRTKGVDEEEAAVGLKLRLTFGDKEAANGIFSF